MKKFPLILLLFSNGFVIAQSDTSFIFLDKNDEPCQEHAATKYAVQTKEGTHWKKVVYDIADDKPMYGAYYSDAACSHFDGPYTSFSKAGKMVEKGRYINNKKNGTWLRYEVSGRVTDSAYYKNGIMIGLAMSWHKNGAIRDSMLFDDNGNGVSRRYWPDGTLSGTGNFIAGQKDGLWRFYHRNGVPCQEVKFKSDSALEYTCYDVKGSIQTKDCHFEKEATFKGGETRWINYLSGKLSSVQLPKAYYEGRLYGTIYITFIVDPEGKVTDVKALNSIDPDIDRIALNIIKQSPRWEPAVQYNRGVYAYRRQPLTFAKAE